MWCNLSKRTQKNRAKWFIYFWFSVRFFPVVSAIVLDIFIFAFRKNGIDASSPRIVCDSSVERELKNWKFEFVVNRNKKKWCSNKVLNSSAHPISICWIPNFSHSHFFSLELEFSCLERDMRRAFSRSEPSQKSLDCYQTLLFKIIFDLNATVSGNIYSYTHTTSAHIFENSLTKAIFSDMTFE